MGERTWQVEFHRSGRRIPDTHDPLTPTPLPRGRGVGVRGVAWRLMDHRHTCTVCSRGERTHMLEAGFNARKSCPHFQPVFPWRGRQNAARMDGGLKSKEDQSAIGRKESPIRTKFLVLEGQVFLFLGEIKLPNVAAAGHEQLLAVGSEC